MSEPNQISETTAIRDMLFDTLKFRYDGTSVVVEKITDCDNMIGVARLDGVFRATLIIMCRHDAIAVWTIGHADRPVLVDYSNPEFVDAVHQLATRWWECLPVCRR